MEAILDRKDGEKVVNSQCFPVIFIIRKKTGSTTVLTLSHTPGGEKSLVSRALTPVESDPWLGSRLEVATSRNSLEVDVGSCLL